MLKFVKYLPEFGWQPHVLTVQDGDYPARDESLLAEIPRHAIVHRTKIFGPYSLYRKLTGKPSNAPVDVENIPQGGKKASWAESAAEFIRSTFFIPDARIGWYPYAVPVGHRIIREHNIDAIYSSSPPYTTAVIARNLLTGEESEYRCHILCNATGPWAPKLAALAGVTIRLRPAKGIHLVLDRRITNVAVTSQCIDGREIFIMPYENTSILGTTDDDYYGDMDNLTVSRDEVQYLLEGINIIRQIISLGNVFIFSVAV